MDRTQLIEQLRRYAGCSKKRRFLLGIHFTALVYTDVLSPKPGPSFYQAAQFRSFAKVLLVPPGHQDHVAQSESGTGCLLVCFSCIRKERCSAGEPVAYERGIPAALVRLKPCRIRMGW